MPAAIEGALIGGIVALIGSAIYLAIRHFQAKKPDDR